MADSRLMYPQVGIVKGYTDVQRMGRILVHLPELGNPDERSSWYTAEYMSPFGGSTPLVKNTPDGRQFEQSSHSYGMWFPVPDIGNKVIVIFANGEPGKCFYIGSVFQQYQNCSIPGIGGTRKVYEDGEEKSDVFIPSAEYNKLRLTPGSGFDVENPTRPVYVPLHQGLTAQGLSGDMIRGPSSTSARRTTKPTVYGWSTPRGSTITCDDGYRDEEIEAVTTEDYERLPNPAKTVQGQPENVRYGEGIRIRTRSGAQILVNEEHGMIYMVSRDGNNWVEMANDGHIDVYAANDVSIRSEQSINLRADKDVNIEAGKNINMKAVGESMYVEAKKDIHMYAHQDMKVTVEGYFDLMVGSDIKETAGGNIHVSASGEYAEDASKIWMNSGKAEAATVAETPHVYDLSPSSSSNETQTSNTSVTKSIADRVPEHEPWKGHDAQLANAGTSVRPSVSSGGDTGIYRSGSSSGGSSGGGSRTYSTSSTANVPPYRTGTATDADVGAATERVIAGEEDTTSPKFEASEMQLSEEGQAVILDSEAYRATKYWDQKGYSVGYGHLITPQEERQGYILINDQKHYLSEPMSEETAHALFLQDSKRYQDSIRQRFKGTQLTQAQFDAATSLAYNVGTGGVGDNFTAFVKQGDLNSATYHLIQHSNSNGKRLGALVARREEEARMLRNGDYPVTRTREEHRQQGLAHLKRTNPAAYNKLIGQ